MNDDDEIFCLTYNLVFERENRLWEICEICINI